MRDCLKNRGGFDRVLMAVAATFLTVSADLGAGPADHRPQQRRGTRDRRRRPEPEPATSRRRPHPISRSTPPASVHRRPSREAPKAADRSRRPRRGNAKPPTSSPRRARRSERRPRHDEPRRPPSRNGRRAAPPVAAPATAATPAAEPVKAASNVPPADQPVADKLQGHARRQDARAISTARTSAPPSRISTAPATTRRSGPRTAPDDARQGRHRAPEGCGLRRPQSARLSGAGFRRRDHAGRAGRRRSETDRQHARLCAPGAERPHALVAGQRPTSSIPEHPTDPTEVLTKCRQRQGRLRRARQLQPAAEALSRR